MFLAKYIFFGFLQAHYYFHHAIPRGVSLTTPIVFIIYHSKYYITMKIASERFHYAYCLGDQRMRN